MHLTFPHTVTWWAATKDGYGGNTFASPVLLAGRWEERMEQVITRDGKTITSKAVAFLQSDVSVGDYLALGDLSGSADPSSLGPLAWQVMQFNKVGNIKASVYERKAMVA